MQNLFSKLARQTSGRPLIKEIDGLRALAILAVVASHFNLHLTRSIGLDEDFLYSNPLSRFLELSSNGVSIFFCISAFILCLPFIEQYLYNGQPVVLKQYYLRRLTRLEPPYLLVLTALLLFQVVLVHEGLRESLPHYISSFLYSHNIVYGRRSTINPVAWTLEIEIQFYLLLPLLAKLFLIGRAAIRRLVFVALIVACGMLYARYDSFFIAAHLQYSLLAYLPVFFMGFLLADVYMQYQHLLRQKSLLWDIAFAAGFVLVMYCNGDVRFYMQWLEYAGYLLLFVGVFKGFVTNRIFTTNWVMLTGSMCYSIYLLHYAVLIFVMDRLTAKWLTYDYYKDLLLQAVIVLPLVLLVGTLFYWLVEKPCMDRLWPKKLVQRIRSMA